ncbi:SPOR domain-containing protein [Sphingomonas kaistensis]|uniref:SPOR domain-containing protein n=1 Tax=Sphingomonas kaistensis TaxID=298708 RepID=A0ABZ2G367_9SPHN
MATPTERLSWRHDEPPAPAAAIVQPGKGGSMWPWYLLLLLLVAAVGAGAWWLSTGKEAPPPQLPAEESLPIPVSQAPTSEPPMAPEMPVNEAVPEIDAPPPAAVTNAPPVARAPERRPSARASSAGTADGNSSRTIFPADDAAPAPSVQSPGLTAAYNPRPYSGRVVQLGAFPTRKQAEDEWKRVTRRYPYLTTKTKMVNTVDVVGLGTRRPTRMYRLQLGTSSQAQSVVICQQLERAGLSCVVVY